MSFAATLHQRAHIYARAAGQESWNRLTAEPVACRVVALSPREMEIAWSRLQAEVTHRGRALPHPALQAGHKLVVNKGAGGAGGSFVIVAVRHVDHPAPAGHVVFDLVQVEEPTASA